MERGEKERKGQKKKGEEEDAWWGWECEHPQPQTLPPSRLHRESGT